MKTVGREAGGSLHRPALVAEDDREDGRSASTGRQEAGAGESGRESLDLSCQSHAPAFAFGARHQS